jgi:membrane-associated phospholipid phosphatase
MPWLRSRPPRAVVTTHGSPEHERTGAANGYLRRLNTLILDGASIQANTLPSGHVSGAVAAALGVMAVDVVVGSWLVVAAGLIAVAAVAGRYHYVVDCVAGAAVALVFSSLM